MNWYEEDLKLTLAEDARFEQDVVRQGDGLPPHEIDEARFRCLDADYPPPDLNIPKHRAGVGRTSSAGRPDPFDPVDIGEVSRQTSSLGRLFLIMLLVHVALVGAVFIYDQFHTGFYAIVIPVAVALGAVLLYNIGAGRIWAVMSRSGSAVVSRLVQVSSQWKDAPLGLLKLFRWFVPRDAREEIDLSIADLKEDRREMKRQKKSTGFIFCVLAWHCARIVAAYVLDGALRLLQPVAAVWMKRK